MRHMRFATNVTTAPTAEPITMGEAKEYAKIEIADDDQLIHTLVRSARVYVEGYLRRALITQTITMTVDWGFQILIDSTVGDKEKMAITAQFIPAMQPYNHAAIVTAAFSAGGTYETEATLT